MKRKWLICMLLFFCSLGETGCAKESVHLETENILRTENNESVLQADQTGEGVDDGQSERQESSKQSVVYVFVCGAVVTEGVYELPPESRVQDALLAAGGFLPEADTDIVNLADIVSDGQKIYFPFEGEYLEEYESAPQAGISNGKVNINTATKEQLMELPGIGNAKADGIIRYRETNGAFQDIQDIKNVSGIGDSIYQQIEELIIVS